MAGKKKSVKKRSEQDNGKNIRIPSSDYDIIKKYVEQHNYKIGRFMASIVVEKIQNENKS